MPHAIATVALVALAGALASPGEEVAHRLHTVTPIWPAPPYQFACPARTYRHVCARLGRVGTRKCAELYCLRPQSWRRKNWPHFAALRGSANLRSRTSVPTFLPKIPTW
jgi:hypothetical protein